MDKLRVFQIATLGLLLLNVLLLAFIFFAPRPGGGRSPLRTNERFGFDKAQEEQFHNLARAHKQQMRATNDRQTELLQNYFLQLATDSAANPGPLPPGVATFEREKITSTYRHFLDIKNMLHPDQQVDFPGFVDDALKRILLKNDRPPPRKGRQ